MTLKFPKPEPESELTFHSKRTRRDPKPLFEGCDHKQVTVDEDARTLTCRACGAMVEPFDYVLLLARTERKIYSKAKFLEQQWRDKFEDAKSVRKETCKHTRARKGANGNVFCPSCETWFPPERLPINPTGPVH